MPASSSTVARLDPGDRNRSDDVFRWLLLSLIVVATALGLLGLLGPRVGTATATDDTHRLTVRYDEINRPGLSATWDIEVTSFDGPLPPEVEISAASAYFEIFDENGFTPQPVSETTRSDETTWRFETDPGSTTLVISLDARSEPGWRRPVSGHTTLHLPDREPLTVDYRTVLLP